MVKIATLIGFALFLVTVGSVCLFAPSKIQGLAMRSAEKGLTSKMEFLQRYIRSDAYLLNVRVVGLVAIVMAISLVWAMMRSNALG